MTRVLAIIGSPRKGHTYQVVQRVEQGLTRVPDAQFEYVFLGDVKLEICRGCYVCQSRGEQHCPLNDERAALVEKMQQADGVIFASPTYTNNVSSLMKNLMDRIAYGAHRPAFLGKPAMLVTTASSMTGATIEALSWFGYTGFEIVSHLGVSWWPSPHRAWREERAVERRFERAVGRFEQALRRGPARSLSLKRILQLNVGKATATIDPTFFVADYEYHHGKGIEQRGFAVSGWKKLLGRVAHWLAVRWMDRRMCARSGGRPQDSRTQ